MQVMLWPIERLRVKDFAIEMLFEYEEDDGSTLMWCQGKVVDFIRESKDKHVFVKIEWSPESGFDSLLALLPRFLHRPPGFCSYHRHY